MKRQCRISVLKRNFDKELTDEYGVEGFGPCTHFRDGQAFLTNGVQRPDGFCDEAWSAIHQYVFALAHNDGKNPFFDDDWMRDPNVAVCCCNDGLRPVVFKIEGLDR